MLIFAALASGAYEKICLLFNIGALESQIASAQNLNSEDGIKLAAKMFQVHYNYNSTNQFNNLLWLWSDLCLDLLLLFIGFNNKTFNHFYNLSNVLSLSMQVGLSKC